MSGPSKIEWTQRTWNPIVGCSIHSPGCKLCYAMKDAWRLMHNPHPAIAAKFAGTAKVVNGKPVWTGRINLDEAALLAPLKRKLPTVWFVNSMSDLFHESVSDETINLVFAMMVLCPQHKFQLLTKRSSRMREYLTAFEDHPEAFGKALAHVVRAAGLPKNVGLTTIDDMQWPLPNVWLGVSVEDQARRERLLDLAQTPASVRFMSGEPLIEGLSLTDIPLNDGPDELGIQWLFDALSGEHYFIGDDGFKYGGDGPAMEPLDWVIAGGESGASARPMHPDWARSLRDQCAAAGVAFFFKQWGNWLPCRHLRAADGFWTPRAEDGSDRVFRFGPIAGRSTCIAVNSCCRSEDDQFFWWFPKKVAGRLLDGVEHNGMPA